MIKYPEIGYGCCIDFCLIESIFKSSRSSYALRLIWLYNNKVYKKC